MKKIKVLDWIRSIRNESYEKTKNMTDEELVTYHRKQAEIVRERLSKYRRSSDSPKSLAS